MEQESLQNTIIEYRFANYKYTPDKTYKSARIIPLQMR